MAEFQVIYKENHKTKKPDCDAVQAVNFENHIFLQEFLLLFTIWSMCKGLLCTSAEEPLGLWLNKDVG